jgi:hypothetical protein
MQYYDWSLRIAAATDTGEDLQRILHVHVLVHVSARHGLVVRVLILR